MDAAHSHRKRGPLSPDRKKKPSSRNAKRQSRKKTSHPFRGSASLQGTERRNAADLVENRLKYKFLIERSLQGVLLVEGYPPKIIFANKAMAKIFGYKIGEFLRLTLDDLKKLVDPEDREIFFNRYRERLAGKKIASRYEFRIIRKDGTTGWIEMFASRIEHKNKTLVQATFIDVSERKRAEDGLSQSEEKYSTIIGSMQDGYYEVDLSGSIIFFNDAMTDMVGYNKADLPGMNYRSFCDTEVAKKMFRTCNRVFRTKKSERVNDWEFIRKDGSRRIVDVSVSLIRDAGGAAAGFRGIVRDITEDKRIEQALRASEERYRNVYNTAPLAFVLWDGQGRITDWNRHAEEVFGWPRKDVLGRNCLELLLPNDDQARREDFIKQVYRGTHSSGITCNNLTRSGEIITCEWNSTIFYDPEGNVQEVLSLALDITEQKKLEEELFQSRKMESIGRLAGGIAHDLNNMLTPIIGYADLLLMDVPMDEVKIDYLIQVKDAAERARDLTRQLLAFSRKQIFEMRVMNLGEIVSGFETILRRTIREDIDIAITVSPGAGNIMTDSTQIHQIIVNLAVNAQEAMPKGGKLAIDVSNITVDETPSKKHRDVCPGRYVLLTFSDTGCGMNHDTLEHMFEPFYTTRELGNGMGLPTVYGIVKQHNGSIAVSSKLNRGTVIKIFFPEADCSAVLPEDGRRDTIAPSNGETILIVEDEETVRMLVEKILKKNGYRVVTAGDADEALSIASGDCRRIDLLLTDVIMPKTNGKSLYRKIAALRRDIKVLYMSGYTHDVITSHGIMDEGAHFIQKPFSFQSLAGKVREVLDS